MSKLKTAFIVLLALGFGSNLVPAQPKSAQSSSLSASKIERIDAAVKAWMIEKKAPALSVAIVQENKVVFEKGYGVSDLENNIPATTDTVYRLASIAKTITAIAIMQLVERGKIDLNSPVNKYCPAYPEKQVLKDAPDKQFSITIRQLLVHQSGVRHNKIDEILTTKHYNTINEAIATIKDEPLVAEPESRYFYSTPGYTLLGCSIEGVTGMPYFDYIRENILKPAGMTRTYIDEITAIIPNRARGYQRVTNGDIKNAPLHNTSIKVPGGGLATTVDDLAKLAIAINANQLVKNETAVQMWTKPKSKDGKIQDYAMGVLINGEGDQLKVFNDGGQAGTRTYLFMMPRQKFAITCMTNLQNAFCEELLPKFGIILNDK